MKIFVTGGSRGIGKCVVNDQRARGNEVVAPQRHMFDLTKPLPDMGKFDAIIHCASESNATDEVIWNTNVAGTKNLMMWAGGTNAERIVLMSSGNVPMGLNGVYTWSKDAQELVVASGAHATGMEYNIIRPYFTYGPETNPHRAVMSTILRALNPVPGCFQARLRMMNPIYIDDLMQVVDMALQADGNTVTNCGGPDVVTLPQLTAMIIKKLGGKHAIETRDEEVVDMSGQRVGQTSLSDGLDKTIEWIRTELI